MISFKTLTGLSILAPHSKNPFVSASRSNASLFSSSHGFKKAPMDPLRYQFGSDNSTKNGENSIVEEDLKGHTHHRETPGREEKGISGIHVPRQRHISVPKADLLDTLVSMFESKEDADEFVRLSMCLDSILHAEHKGMLEEMRIYYSLNQSQDQKGSTDCSSERSEEAMPSRHHLASDDSIGTDRGTNISSNDDGKALYLHNNFDLRDLFGFFPGIESTNSVAESRVAVATNFQRSFMKLLRDAEFEELSAQDLMLTHALDSDYLLTLPIYVDWKKASESKAIIFRRGYATERQRGLLIVEKLDYLQSKLLQEIFFSLSRPLKNVGRWLNEALKSSSEAHELKIWSEKVKIWLKEQYSPESTWSYAESTDNRQLESDQITDSDLPIWLAAQRAVPRYEGFLSSIGPRRRLIRRFFTWIGIIPSIPEASINPEKDTKYSETYLRPNFLPRITLSNIWEPATRETCGNNVWKMLKTAVSILFSQSTLQEPAFQELILLYTAETSQTETKVDAKSLPLQLKIYEKIPIPDLPVIFPHKKLSFRILDTVRLDVASIVGLLAYFVNYKFENIISSPSAVLLDVIAISTLVIYVSRVVLGYKQTWDRYQLLVNKTLYEKTVASGFGSVYFLLDASEQQQYKEAILAYALLLHSKRYEVSCRRSISDACERFVYDKFNEKIEMPIERAMNTLLRLDLVRESHLEGNLKLEALPCSEAFETLRKHWDGLLMQKT